MSSRKLTEVSTLIVESAAKIQELNADHNELRELTPDIFNLPALTSLNLSHNKVPPSFVPFLQFLFMGLIS